MEEGYTEPQQSNKSGLKSGTQVLERPRVNEETEKRLPNIRIEVRLSKHGSAEDADGLEDKFKRCRIFFPETFGWLPSHLDALRKLSIGSIAPGIALQRWIYKDERSLTRDEKFFRMIYKSNKYIAFLDVPDGHPLVAREKENRFPRINFGSDFGNVLYSVREYIKGAGDIQVEREAYMLDQLNPQIQKILEDHQELKKEPEIAVLIDIGAGHTSLPGKLEEKYKTTVFDREQEFLYLEDSLTKYTKSVGSDSNKQVKEEILDDDLIARVAAEWSLSTEYPDRFQTDSSLSNAVELKKRISRFSFDELKATFEEAHDLKEWTNILMRGVEEHVKVPTSEE